jgi:hypothetical protein
VRAIDAEDTRDRLLDKVDWLTRTLYEVELKLSDVEQDLEKAVSGLKNIEWSYNYGSTAWEIARETLASLSDKKGKG